MLRPLRERGLVRRDGSALVLTAEGLTVLARRDRAAVGATLERVPAPAGAAAAAGLGPRSWMGLRNGVIF
ncbi:MAG: hypothetical protein F4Z77_08980 [Dehalococcoidia bacterium]|nr:hypothetical protein [Dehalococcoidia bacterium]MXZ88514.1 hypothetical protein [Dehalococcoidia bacterium]MYA53265.1 hypothetical protein [Dehalococcoidia bacterium]MYI86212.1 hypothetical protein [Dehalococcoidia bacterium]